MSEENNEKMRESFEAWAESEGYGIRSLTSNGEYDCESTQYAWEGWQARQAEIDDLLRRILKLPRYDVNFDYHDNMIDEECYKSESQWHGTATYIKVDELLTALAGNTDGRE